MEHNNTLLHYAVESGNTDAVVSLIEIGTEINTADINDYTPLHKAIRNGYADIVKVLLKHGAKTEVTASIECLYPIHLAAKYGYLRIIQMLLAYGADAGSTSELEYCPLHFAAEEGHLEVIDYFLQIGIQLDAVTNMGHTPMVKAIQYGKIQAVKLLIQKNADVNKTDEFRYTPLHWASRNGYLEIVELLLAKGAKVNERSYEGWTPLHLAARHGYKDIVQILFENGGTCQLTKIADNSNPVFIAAERGHTEVVDYFLSRGATAGFKTASGYTLLHAATRSGRRELAEYLIDLGANLNNRTYTKGHSALHFSIMHACYNITELLLQKGAKLEDKDRRGWVPLEIVSEEYISDILLTSRDDLIKVAKVLMKYTLLNRSQDYFPIDVFPNDELFLNELFNFCSSCRIELERMKNKYISNTNVSLYKFVRSLYDDTKFVTYLYNESLMKELKNIDFYVQELTIYKNIPILIKEKIRRGTHRQQLMEEADILMNRLTPNLPTESKWKIFSYLTLRDLHRFILSFSYT